MIAITLSYIGKYNLLTSETRRISRNRFAYLAKKVPSVLVKHLNKSIYSINRQPLKSNHD